MKYLSNFQYSREHARVFFIRLRDIFFRIITLSKFKKTIINMVYFLIYSEKIYILITTESKTCSYDKAHCYCLFHSKVFGYLQATLVHLQFGIMTYTQHCPIISI